MDDPWPSPTPTSREIEPALSVPEPVNNEILPPGVKVLCFVIPVCNNMSPEF